LFAAGGCATGFLWSVVAGESDLETTDDWVRALMGCVGGAINAVAIHGITDEFTRDEELPNILAGTWIGIQAATSLTNWIGHENGWEREPAFNAIAFPLNFAAAPLFSTLGLLWAGIGELATGLDGEVGVFGGMLIFDHDLCISSTPMTMGAIGHCFRASHPVTPRHEQGHLVQYSIMGDFGFLSIGIADFVIGTIGTAPNYYGLYLFISGPGALTLEPWARDYERTFHLR
jgi:hypothetical protein